MPAPVRLRTDFSATALRPLASKAKHANQSRRLLSAAAVLDGESRAEAAAIGGTDRQTLRDRVHRFNAAGPDGLKDDWGGGVAPRLSAEQRAELAQIVEAGPDREKDGVVRWRRVDLQPVIAGRFGVDYCERYLCGGAEDLSAALGAATNLDADGRWTLTYRWARSAMLLAAKAAGVGAVETVFVDYRDSAGLEASSRAAAQEGFTGRAAIHPAQVAPINRAFAPSPEDVEQARKIIAAFDRAGGVGTVGIDGKMFDIPHLKRAQKLLALHGSFAARD